MKSIARALKRDAFMPQKMLGKPAYFSFYMENKYYLVLFGNTFKPHTTFIQIL